ADTGSVFVQIGDENVHRVRALMEEVFGNDNFVSLITFTKTSGASSDLLAGVVDHVVWFAKNKTSIKYRQLFIPKQLRGVGAFAYNRVENASGIRRPFTERERQNPNALENGARAFTADNITS